MASLCPRCGAALPALDGSPASFCANCGLPQLRVSADVAITAADLVASAGSPASAHAAAPAPPSTPPDPSAVRWRTALPIAVVAALAAILPSLLFPAALALGGAGSLCLTLIPLAATGAVSFYRRRHSSAGARAGGRIGAVTGVLLAALATFGTALAGYILRYGRHSRELENLLTDNFNRGIAQMRSGNTPLPPETLGMLHAPEIRAGGYIVGQCVIGLAIIVLGALFGALAGAIRRRSASTPE